MTDREAVNRDWIGDTYAHAFRLIRILTWPFRMADRCVEEVVLAAAEAWIRFREKWEAYMEGEWKD